MHLTSLDHGCGPSADPGVRLFTEGALLAAHDFPRLALDKVGLLQTSEGLREGAVEHSKLRALSLGDDALLRTHGPHGRTHSRTHSLRHLWGTDKGESASSYSVESLSQRQVGKVCCVPWR